MKKLIVLVLVLCMTSGAYAALSGIELSVDGVTNGPGIVMEIELGISEYLGIDVHGPAGYSYTGYVIIEEAGGAGGEWVTDQEHPAVLRPAAGDDAAMIVPYFEGGWGDGYEVTAAAFTGDPAGGKQFQMLYHCLGPDSEWVRISLWDVNEDDPDYLVGQDFILIHQIPEPMTIALLGLGGLFVLRRRK